MKHRPWTRELMALSLPLKSNMDAAFKPPIPFSLFAYFCPSSEVDERDQKSIHMHGLSVQRMSGLRLSSFVKVLVMTLNESCGAAL